MALETASGYVLVSGDWVLVSILMVGLRFLNSCLKGPFVVAGESGRCLEMSSYVRPGQMSR